MADYLSRNEAINAIESLKSSMPAKDNYAKGYDAALWRALIAVREVSPAANVQPVEHGRWESSQRTIETGTVYCSNCAIEYYISDLQTVGDCNGIVHYCPNCGAKMDAEPDEPWQSE